MDSRRSEELLRDLADGDADVIEFLRRRGTSRGGVTLDSETFQVAQIAALTAVDASRQSWSAVFDSRESEITFDTVLMTLVAAAPIVGMPRVISAAANIVGSTNLADELDDEIV
jgi:alkylhydroperoxidase/carboxymuconolactone decarboxylase family protein YurZ